MGRDRRGDLEWFAFYYDPIERQACTFPDHVTALAALVTLPYIYPQRPDWGAWLYEQAVRKLGWSDPRARINQFIPDPRTTSIALMMAHEIGDDVTEHRMRDYVEAHCQPRFFGDENDRFGFFFGFDEPYPRGQQSALLMVPEVGGRGAWSRWSNDANLAKFAAPTVEGVDYPSVGLSVARNDVDRGELLLSTYAATPSHDGRSTSMRVVQLPDLDRVRVTCDGEEFTAWHPTGANAIELDLTIGDHVVVVRTGYHDRGGELAHEHAQGGGTPTPAVVTVTGAAADGSPAMPSATAIAAVASCRCCKFRAVIPARAVECRTGPPPTNGGPVDSANAGRPLRTPGGARRASKRHVRGSGVRGGVESTRAGAKASARRPDLAGRRRTGRSGARGDESQLDAVGESGGERCQHPQEQGIALRRDVARLRTRRETRARHARGDDLRRHSRFGLRFEVGRELALKRRVVLDRATVGRHVARDVDLRADEARLYDDNADAELLQLHPQCVRQRLDGVLGAAVDPASRNGDLPE